MSRPGIALRWALSQGISAEDLAAAVGVSPAQLTGGAPDEPEAQLVWEALARLSADSLVGLHAGEAFRSDQLGPVGSAFVHAEHVSAALAALAQLLPLLMRGASGHYASGPSGGVFQYSPRPPVSRHGVDALFAGILTVLRDSTGVHVVPRAVDIDVPWHGDGAEYERVFGLVPRWGADTNTLHFAADDLSLPLRGASPGVSQLLVEQGPALMAVHRGLSRFEREVEKATLAALGAQDGTLRRVADLLGTPTRTLQRRLARSGTSFAALRSRVVRQRAEELLRDRELSIDQVASELGYSSRSSFERAFFRWFRRSPADARVGRLEGVSADPDGRGPPGHR